MDHIHKINPKYGIEIILPQQRWPNLKLNQTTDVMKMIHQHREVYLNASTNDLGMIYHTEASGYADLWIHILDENENILEDHFDESMMDRNILQENVREYQMKIQNIF